MALQQASGASAYNISQSSKKKDFGKKKKKRGGVGSSILKAYKKL